MRSSTKKKLLTLLTVYLNFIQRSVYMPFASAPRKAERIFPFNIQSKYIIRIFFPFKLVTTLSHDINKLPASSSPRLVSDDESESAIFLV